MASVSFRPASIDAVVAFYSVIHVPREEHAGVFAEIVRWLRPGGLFVASLGVSGNPGGTEDDWLGTPMYWSGFDAETNRALIEAAGIDVERADVVETMEDGRPVPFSWVVGRRPRPRLLGGVGQ